MAAHRRKHRTAAQKAATRRMIAANRARRAPNPIGSHRRKRRTLRSRAASAVRHAVRRVRRRRNPIHLATHRRHRRRNPIRVGGIMNHLLMPAVTAASGAIALDVLWGFLPIPANIKTGPLKYVAKGAGAVAMAMLGSKIVKKSTADNMAIGALTVIMHDAARELIARVMPGMHLGFYNPAYPAGDMFNVGEYVGEYVGDLPSPTMGMGIGMGEYMGMADGSSYDAENAYNQYYYSK